MELVGAGLLVLMVCLVLFLVFFFIYSGLLYLTAGWAQIENKTMGKALLSTFCGFLASIFISFVLGLVPLIGWLISFLASIFIPILITQALFETTLTKATVAELIRMAIVALFSAVILFALFAFVGLEVLQEVMSDTLQNYNSGIQILFG